MSPSTKLAMVTGVNDNRILAKCPGLNQSDIIIYKKVRKYK